MLAAIYSGLAAKDRKIAVVFRIMTKVAELHVGGAWLRVGASIVMPVVGDHSPLYGP